MIKLAVFDLDGTLTNHHSVWEYIHKALGTWKNRGEKHLEQWVNNEITYEQFAQRDAVEWQGLHIQRIRNIVDSIQITQGAGSRVKLVKDTGSMAIIISSGLDILADRVAGILDVDEYYTNRLMTDYVGRLTGEVRVRVQADKKDAVLLEVRDRRNIKESEIMTVGDTYTDIPLFKKSGLSFAVRNNDDISKEAKHTAEDLYEISDILKKHYL